MNDLEIDAAIRQAQQIKRQGQIARAVELLENLLSVCRYDGTQAYSLAPIYKSLAKLCYIQRDFPRARSFYTEAITIYASSQNEEQAITCAIHLGFCSDEFIRSQFFNPYVESLQTGIDTDLPQVIVERAAQCGAEMYNIQRKQSASNASQPRSQFSPSQPPTEHLSMDIIQFGSDFLWLAKELRVRGNQNTMDNFDDATSKYLLFDWGLTPGGVDESSRVFWQRVERGALGDFADALKRLSSAINNEDRKAHLVRDVSTILQIQQSSITDQQIAFVNGIQGLLDMKPSEFQAALGRGGDLANALIFICRAYSNSNRSKV
jgi:tetratricopeptide (TPR) repeat protein